MIYRGFNEAELKRITEILERNSVEFHVSVPQESLEYIEDKTKRVNHRFLDNLLQIEIEKEEFVKISQSDLNKLFDLRIYPEEDSPFTDEELSEIPVDQPAKEVRKPDQNAKSNQIAAILAVLVMGCFFLWKNGFFK